MNSLRPVTLDCLLNRADSIAIRQSAQLYVLTPLNHALLSSVKDNPLPRDPQYCT